MSTTSVHDPAAAPAPPPGPITPAPRQIAPDTWLLPHLVPSGPDRFLFVNTMLILGAEPVVVDTGAAVFGEAWLDALSTLVDPNEVRWVFLSHDDGDHIGNLLACLERAPQATVVANFFANERMALEAGISLPLDRMVWLDPGSSFVAGDRRLHLVRPPIFDGPTTRGLYDETTGVLWAADAFAAFTTGGLHHADIPGELYDESFALLNSLISPWHEWLDPAVYGRHLDALDALGVRTIASCHGPLIEGASVADAFGRVRAMAGAPIVPPPGQALLDELVAGLLAGSPT